MKGARPARRKAKTTAAAPGRRRSDDARAAAEEVQRRAIADCACRVIGREGLDGATLRRIAAALGVTTGMLVRYFPTKDDLLIATLRHALARLEAALAERRGARAGASLREQLDAFLAALPFGEEQRRYWRVVIAFRSAALGSERLRRELGRYAKGSVDALRLALADALGLPEDHARVALATDALDAVLDGLGAAAALEPERYPSARVAAMVEACLAGLLAGPPQRRSPARH